MLRPANGLMMLSRYLLAGLLLLPGLLPAAGSPAGASATSIEDGRRMYMEGVLPSGETMQATVQGDIRVSGTQVICSTCHRRSGMGTSEGQEVVPIVTGDVLYQPLRLPTSKPPLPPALRPAYTDATLKRAIRDGIGADGKPLGPLMPRYRLDDAQLEPLLAYLGSLDTETSPGVTEHDIHFATVIAADVPESTRRAYLDVLERFVEQKNAGTRHETQRSAHAPWHKDPLMKSYRKWVLHVWELQGPADGWPAQLDAHYREQPVFAVLGGLATGSWAPVHGFCEQAQLPCLFPGTRLPVLAEDDFYTVYFSRGMTLEGEVVAQHLSAAQSPDRPVVQVFRPDDEAATVAATALRATLGGQGGKVSDITLEGAADAAFWRRVTAAARDAVLVLWLQEGDLAMAWPQLAAADGPPVYLSGSLYGDRESVPVNARARTLWVVPHAVGTRLRILLARSTGWLRMNRILDNDEQEAQANAFFTVKLVGGALAQMRGYYSREYLLEQIEHMVDSAFYTSMYPRISLAPGQRYVAKGCFIARLQDNGRLVTVSDWLIPGFGN